MRISTIFLLLSTIICLTAQAQVTEGVRQFSIGQANALTIQLKELPRNKVQDLYLKYVKKTNGKTIENKIFAEIATDNAEIKSISPNTIDIYAQILQKDGSTCELAVAFYLGGVYLNSTQHPDKYQAGVAWLQEFSNQVFDQSVELKLDITEDSLAVKEREFDRLLKEQAQLEADIVDYEEKLAAARDALNKNKSTQLTIQPEIGVLQRRVNELKAKLKH